MFKIRGGLGVILFYWRQELHFHPPRLPLLPQPSHHPSVSPNCKGRQHMSKRLLQHEVRAVCFYLGMNDITYLSVTSPLYVFGLLLLVQGLVAVVYKAPLKLSPPRFPSSGLGANKGGGRW